MALTRPKIKAPISTRCVVNIKRKYNVASSAIVLKTFEILSPAFFDRATKYMVNEKARESVALMSSPGSTQVGSEIVLAHHT